MNTPHPLPLLRHAFSALVCLTSLGLASHLHAQTTITTATGDGADAWVGRTGQTTNNGGATTFQVRAGNSDERLAYLRFDLGSVVPANITAPSLTLVAASNITATFTLWGLVNATNADALVTSGGWSETGLLFTNAPARTGTGNALTTSSGAQTGDPTSYAVQIGTFDLSSITAGTSITLGTGLTNATQSVGLTSGLLSFLQADTTRDVSFIITTAGTTTALSFYAKEFSSAVNAPALSFSTVPEPSTYALVTSGLMMGVALLRRRRS